MQLNSLSPYTRKLRPFPLPPERRPHLSALDAIIATSAGQKNHEASFLSPNVAYFLMRGGLCTEPEVYVQKTPDFWPADGFDVSTACMAGSQGSPDWGPTGNLGSPASGTTSGQGQPSSKGCRVHRPSTPSLWWSISRGRGRFVVEQNEIRAQNVETFPPPPEENPLGQLHGWWLTAALPSRGE